MRLSVLAVWAVLAITCVYGANPDIILSPRDTTVRYLAYGDTQDFTFFAYNVPETNRTAEYAVTTFVIIPEGFNIPNYTPYADITGKSNGTLATYNMAFPNNTIIFPSVVLDDPINTYIDYDFTVGLINAGFSSETYDKPFGYIVYITPVEEIFDGTTSDSVIKAETIVSGERRAYRVSRPAYGEQPDLISFSQCKSQNLENSTDTTPIRAAILWNRYSDYNGNSSKNFASDIVCGGSDDATLKLADPEGADSYSAMCPTYVDSTSDPSLSHSSVYIFVDVMHFWLTDLNATVSYTLTAYPNQTYILPPLEPDTSKNAGPTSYIAPLTLKKSGDDLKISWTVSAVSPGSDIAYYAVYSDYLLDSNTRLALAANHSFANPCFLQSLIPVIPMADVNGDKASAVITNFYKDAVEYNNAPWTVNVLVSNKESAAAYQPSTTKPDTGLSGGAIAGIVIGSIIGAIILIVIIGVVGLYVFRRVAKKDYQNI